MVRCKEKVDQIEVLKILIAVACLGVDHKNISRIHPVVPLFSEVDTSTAQDNHKFGKVMAVKGIGDLGTPADKLYGDLFRVEKIGTVQLKHLILLADLPVRGAFGTAWLSIILPADNIVLKFDRIVKVPSCRRL